MTLTKNVINDRASYSINQVSADDPELIAYVSCNNLTGYHTLRWDWHSPNGYLYLSKSTNFSASSGRYSENASAWHALKIKGDKAEQLHGSWKVKVFIDNRLISSSSFYLVSSSNNNYEAETQTIKKRPSANPFEDEPPPMPPTSGIKIK